MLNELGKQKLTEILISAFGKDIFTEDELTQEFWTNLRIAGNDFFTTKDGKFDFDFFWSDDVKQFIKQNR